MKGYRNAGEIVELTIPASGVEKDMPIQIGAIVVVPTNTIAYDAAKPTERFSGLTIGVLFGYPKIGSQAWTEGQPIYWDGETDVLTSVSGDNKWIGVALEAVGNGAGATTAGEVKFNGMLTQADETT